MDGHDKVKPVKIGETLRKEPLDRHPTCGQPGASAPQKAAAAKRRDNRSTERGPEGEEEEREKNRERGRRGLKRLKEELKNIYFESPSPRSYTESVFDSIKSALGNSSDSPMLSSSQEQYSSTEIISGSSTEYSPLDTEITFKQPQVYLPVGVLVQSDSLSAVSSQSMRDALQNVETVLMEPNASEPSNSTNPEFNESKPPLLTKQRSRTWNHETRLGSPASVQSHHLPIAQINLSNELHPEKRLKEMRIPSANNVKQLLIQCAEALSDNKLNEYELLAEEVRNAVSITGEPIQRLGAYMLEGLVARHESSGTNIYRGLRSREPESKELLSYMQILYDICPYFKFGYMAANGAIADALKNEDRIHIVDFQIAQGTQWITLIQALAARPGGPPHVRITGINDPVAEHARGDGLQLVGSMLSDMSKRFKIPIEFKGLTLYGSEVTREILDIRSGEALAVNFTLQLHHTPDESVDVNNPRDGLLRMVKGLSPKVTTLVEQESNTNTTSFMTRFLETLDYYSAMFESIDVTLARNRKERIDVEQHCLAKDIVNIIACEGKDRVERHELLGKWRSRLCMAGFKPYPLSSYVNSVIKQLLGYYSDKYTLVEKDGALLLGWKNRNLISASAWH
ncbi:chitin-inducible gibberellin-responsive protein 1-like [Canna indica]|uniref:Chitin-inducible gibberellin-responsive protein 1-like n=1 Tax=Canna indica TaxID=4628 RepID=A0AAQ3PXE1_9LILI|nr:chitin-inducible gibberellin-responsive protein 1-like [Canna indica]